jgi:hypothetical protein
VQTERQENDLYNEMYEEHGKLLEQREKEKQDSIKQKILQDKASRDQQLRDETRRRKIDQKENMNLEKDQLNRFRQEMESEKAMQ